MIGLTFLLALCMAIVHLVAGRLQFLNVTPRSRWLSASGGVSVAYVFVHILPELRVGQRTLEEAWSGVVPFLEHHVYLMALFGFVTFYGLERIAILSRMRRRRAAEPDRPSTGVFWLHISSFAVYNGLIGYLLLHLEQPGLPNLLLFFIAMTLHFVVNDYGLKEHHRESYDRLGRWFLSSSVLAGWAIGSVTTIHKAALALLFSFLAGGVILNIIKEELPEERESRFGAFGLGALLYTALLIAL